MGSLVLNFETRTLLPRTVNHSFCEGWGLKQKPRKRIERRQAQHSMK